MKKIEKREIRIALNILNALLCDEKKKIKSIEKLVAMHLGTISPVKIFPSLCVRVSHLEAVIEVLNKLLKGK